MSTTPTCDAVICPVSDDVASYVKVYSLQNVAGLAAPLPPAQSCDLISCLVTDDIPHYVGTFSLQNGVAYTNPQIQIAVPYGDGYYIQPPGTITIVVPPNPKTISARGCQTTIVEPVPDGATQSQIQAITQDVMQQVAAQNAACNTPVTNPTNPTTNPGAPKVFFNTAQSYTCSNGLAPTLTQQLPGFTVSGATVTLSAGIFSAGSQAAADALAQQELQNAVASGAIACGFYNKAQSKNCGTVFTSCSPNPSPCLDGKNVTVPAGTYFSPTSQADADAQAIAQLDVLCQGCGASSFTWTHTTIEDDGGPPLPAVNVNTTGSNYQLIVSTPKPNSNAPPNVVWTGFAHGVWTNTGANPVTVYVSLECNGYQSTVPNINLKANGISFLTSSWNYFQPSLCYCSGPVVVNAGQTLDLVLGSNDGNLMSSQGLGFPTSHEGNLNVTCKVYFPTNC